MDVRVTVIAVIISVLVTAGITYLADFDQQLPPIVITKSTPEINVEKPASEYFKGTHDIKKISSPEELKNILKASLPFGGQFYESSMFAEGVFSETTVQQSEGFTARESKSLDYSTTNVQVANVDESDYLKNDSKYVYIVSKNTLSIIDAYPAKDAELILKIALDIESQYIQNMFLNKDRLVIFYNGQSDDEIIPQYDFVPRRTYSAVTHALIIDITDKENPTILKDYSIDGYFMDARMIGDYAYFVTNNNVDYQYPKFPVIMEGTVRIMTPDVFYFDNTQVFSSFNTLTAIDIFGDTINSESFLVGYSGAFYVSKDNFYLAYQQNTPFGFYGNLSQDRFFDVVVPLLPDNIQDQIRVIRSDSSNPSAQWMKISELLQESYNKMDKSNKEGLFEKIRKALSEYDTRVQKDAAKTIIHKISIDEDKINYIAKGVIPGRLLNQFSMDQSGDRFRVATTVEYHTHQGIIRTNAVYILDEQLEIVGGLDDIAPDESIFSSRFIGDRLYLVTFQQIDPFFVIDLSADTPKILGELKIPGFSNYLHPYDKEHIIGIGRDTKADNNRVEQLGVKIALFNVADVSNPKVVDDIVIGDGSTHSEALNNHKAFFFDKKRNILSIPISGDIKVLDGISSLDTFAPENSWNGFYVFDLDGSDGFGLVGTISHSDSNYYTDSARTFYIDDILYTASEEYLKMNQFGDLKEINSIKLQNTGKFIDYKDTIR